MQPGTGYGVPEIEGSMVPRFQGSSGSVELWNYGTLELWNYGTRYPVPDKVTFAGRRVRDCA
jgi:hypothetical protein